MWLLTLAALAALALSVDCECPGYYEALNKTMKMLTMSKPMDWHGVDYNCRGQFGGGFRMLGQDFMRLSDADKALCLDHEVPLRLKKKGPKPAVWPVIIDSYNYERHEETVNSTYLGHMREEAMPGQTADRVGSLDLSTGLWSLVDESTTFTCAICQRAWIDDIYDINKHQPLARGALEYHFTFYLTETGNNLVNVDEAIFLAEKRLNETLSAYGAPRQTKISVVASEPGGRNSTFLRVRSSRWLFFKDVLQALGGSYSVESWQDMNWCPKTRFEGLDWNRTETGVVLHQELQDFHVASRRCSRKVYPNGDWYAVWDDTLYWVDLRAECRFHGVTKSLSRLQDFAKEVDPGVMNLNSLVEITADLGDLDLPRGGQTVNNLVLNMSLAIAGALSSLAAKTLITNVSSASHGQARALLFDHFKGHDEVDTILFSRKGAPPLSIDPDESHSDNQPIFMSLQLANEMTSTGRVAVHGWNELNVIPTAIFPIVSTLVTVVSTGEPGRSQPPVGIIVDNERASSFFARHYYVRSLGEDEESTLPCPWMFSENSVDTYVCNTWKPGPRNDSGELFLTIVVNVEYVSQYLTHFFTIPRILIGYTTVGINEFALLKVANLTNSYVQPFVDIPRVVLATWEIILLNLGPIESVITANLDHVKVLVSNLTVSDPVVGFSFANLTFSDPVKSLANLTVNGPVDGSSHASLGGGGAMKLVKASFRQNVSAERGVDIVLSAGLQGHGQQLAVLMVTNIRGLAFDSSLDAYIKKVLMIVFLVVTSSSTTDASSEDDFFEIQLLEGDTETPDEVDLNEKNRTTRPSEVKAIFRFQVATWNVEDRDWLVLSCAKLRSTRDSKPVVRCKGLAFDGDRFSGQYLVFESVGFAEAIGTPLLVVLTAAGVMSGVSLASIASTVAALPAWRKDLGHKILLHMALALWFNLALGFTSSFVSVDTFGVACVAVGALRHFFYLAMFAWMLLMSSLQLRRLLSVLGARDTPNLLLKVAFFAWGVPILVVGSLLVFKTDTYQSDLADRGYCYPEGTTFNWSVQAPAATVLALNAVIFIVILLRLYSVLGWGVTVDLQRHVNERTYQMRRLRAVFFTFCLFGITWIFHLMAEYGVFQVKFVYEYLFLMTASLHVFSLSVIFVFCDTEARAEWAQVVAPVRDRWGTWMATLRG